MGKIILDYIEGDNIYVCASCDTHLTTRADLVSKGF